jgi:hypothetical protein
MMNACKEFFLACRISAQLLHELPQVFVRLGMHVPRFFERVRGFFAFMNFDRYR